MLLNRDCTSAVIHVIQIDLDAYSDPMDGLSLTELARCQGFVFEKDRRRYAAAHSALRRVLSSAVSLPASAIAFALGAKGKPELSYPRSTVQFNLSHSGHLALIAVAAERSVGVDIEAHRQVEIDAIADRFFCVQERDVLARIEDETLRVDAFYRCWTRKESFIKATGDGLSCPLNAFDVGLSERRAEVQFLSKCEAQLERQWTTLNLRTSSGYAAALTAEGFDWHSKQWESAEAFIAAQSVYGLI